MAQAAAGRPNRQELINALRPVLVHGLPLLEDEAPVLDKLRKLCPQLDSADPKQRVESFNEFLVHDLKHFEDRDLGDAAIALFTVCFGRSLHSKHDLDSRRAASAVLLDEDPLGFQIAEERILGIMAWHIQSKLWVEAAGDRELSSFGWRLVMCVLVVLPFLGIGGLFGGSSTNWWLGRCSVAALAILWSYIYFRRKYAAPLHESTVRRELGKDVDFLPDRIARSLQNRAANELRVNDFQAEVFALAVIRPSSLRSRIVEKYEPRQRTLYQRVTINIQIPPRFVNIRDQMMKDAGLDPSLAINATSEQALEEGFRVPFPVVILPKGELNDNLRFWGADESLIPALSHSEYLQLVASVLRMIMLKAYRLQDMNNGRRGQLPAEAKAVERAALICIMQRGKHRPRRQCTQTADFTDGVILEGAVERVIERLLALPIPNSRERRSLNLAAELVRKLSNHYAVVASVDCDSDGRAIFGYERTILPELELARRIDGDRLRWLKDRLALGLGARPIELNLGIDNAATCQSFHLLAGCPEGLYLRKQKLGDIDRYIKQASGHATGTQAHHGVPPYYRVRQRLGQPYSHFYARFFPEPTESVVVSEPGGAGAAQKNTLVEMPKLKLYFLEVPPGSIFRAAVTALSCAVLVTIIGWVITHTGDTGTDAPAFLLAFPAIAATWLGFDAPSQRLLEGTLLARLSLAFSALMAIMASGLFMIYKTDSHVLKGSMPFPVHITFFGISETSWGVLSALATINALYVTYKYLIRTWEYKQLSARNPSSAQDIPRTENDGAEVAKALVAPGESK